MNEPGHRLWFGAGPGAPEDFDRRLTRLESSITICSACRSSVTEMTGNIIARAQRRERMGHHEVRPAAADFRPHGAKSQRLATATANHNRLRLSSIESPTPRPHGCSNLIVGTRCWAIPPMSSARLMDWTVSSKSSGPAVTFSRMVRPGAWLAPCPS